MNTPIHDFLTKYGQSNTLRLHMPGHKGKYHPHDITEIYGADSLFEADGIISESEKNASKLYGTKATFFSTAGSTLSIQSMLFMMKKDHRTIYAVRNVHRSFLNASILLDLSVHWIYPTYENTIISGEVDVSTIEETLSRDSSPKALYVTSPDYYGMVADIKSISEVCKKYDTILLVDNAHGTLLNFMDNNLHPIFLGADLCSDSPHKMLPVLTGGGYLHIGNSKYVDMGKFAMSFFGSTSPSYLIMESLDLCNEYISTRLKSDLNRVVQSVESLKSKFKDRFTFANSQEKLHLTFLTWKDGFLGVQLAEQLRKFNIEPEYYDLQSLVLLFSPLDTNQTFERLSYALENVHLDRVDINREVLHLEELNSVMSMREAVFSKTETIPLEQSLGRICAEVKVPCPPAIPIVVSGEVITSSTIEILRNYNINLINVVSMKR
ncbi:MAG: aminotransferase class I/II-fold pyridoxal phosphate-dependent enzyme [Oscillospiraceae bacterium]